MITHHRKIILHADLAGTWQNYIPLIFTNLAKIYTVPKLSLHSGSLHIKSNDYLMHQNSCFLHQKLCFLYIKKQKNEKKVKSQKFWKGFLLYNPPSICNNLPKINTPFPCSSYSSTLQLKKTMIALCIRIPIFFYHKLHLKKKK